MRTARWRAGRCCSAATKARRSVSWACGDLGGIAVAGVRQHAGVGDRLEPARPRAACSSVLSGVPTSVSSIGRARRLRPLSMSMHTLVAIRYSQDFSADRPSKRSSLAPRAQHRLLHGVLGLEGGSRASGSSSRSARGGTARAAVQGRPLHGPQGERSSSDGKRTRTRVHPDRRIAGPGTNRCRDRRRVRYGPPTCLRFARSAIRSGAVRHGGVAGGVGRGHRPTARAQQ